MKTPHRRRALALFALAGLALPAYAGPEAAPLSPTLLYLRTGDVDTSGRAATTLAQAITAAAPSDRFIIQLDGPITPERRAAIAAAGIRLGGYIPSNAYIARLHGADPKAASGLGFVRYLTPYRAEWKLDPELGRRPYVSPERLALRKNGRDLVVVTTFEGADTGEVERAIWSIRGTVIRESEPTGNQLLIEISDAQVPALASIAGVQFVEPAPEVTPRSNYNVRWVVQGNQQDVFPLYNNGLRGEGQIVGILDGRIDVNHCSFLDANPIGPTHRKIVAMQSTGSGNQHGTHVAGTAAGNDPSSANTANTRGVAYLGKIAWASYGAANATDFNTGINFVRAAGARIHTNSWGNDGTTSYDSLSRAVDEQSYNNEDDMICFAVTNQSLLKNPENAKNVLAVGNTQNSPTQTTICTGGAGPTSDGRQKPEIWAPGCATQSSQSGSACGTVSLTGTSMASPAIAGTAMLVRQYYTQGYYPLGLPGGTGFTPSGALIRATLMNTGQDLTGAASGFQTPTGYPSTQEGWGRVRADDALYFPGDTRKLLVRDVRNSSGLSTGGEETVNVNVLGSGEPLRFTLTWTEPPATAGASQAAVNDLDLIVEGPSGVYRGNVFNTATGFSQTGGTRDAKNNTEQVHISAPSVGPWTVRIVGTNVAQGTQGYALVVTGDIVGGTPPPLIVSVPGGVPSLVPPGTPTDLTVRVTPGSQNVVPGSPTMFYRLGTSGSFLTQTLTPLTGDDYRATLPPLLCENTPQFYFTALGDGGATAASPANAPTGLYSTSVGAVTTSTIFAADFEQALPAGWTTTGLWHTSNTATACSPSGTPCAGPWAAYYGIEPPATSSCTFNAGATNNGLLSAPPIAIPAVPSGGSVTLTFCSALITENQSSWDKAEVLINGNPVFRAPDSAAWTTQTVNLTSFAGQTINLAFRFDTVDNVSNNFRGWHVDDVRITATTTGCTNPPQTCYANCDQSTGAPLLTANDFQCFLNKYAAGDTYANCDGSTGSPILTANDFQCFLNKFAAGCS
ncbi:MAG: S8 family serine peptidase [Phycisphaeraceae bacterium]|nr:S8 family serine peptidase [Phycisphaeraceae bacterium]